MKIKVPAYVLYPPTVSPENYAQGKEGYISIDEVEPGSDLAQAVVRAEQEYGTSKARLRAIAKYLQVEEV